MSVHEQLYQLQECAKEQNKALERAKQWIDIDSQEDCICNVSEHCNYCSKAIATGTKVDKALALYNQLTSTIK